MADRYAGMSSRWPEPTRPPATPGDNGKAEAREQIARWLFEFAWHRDGVPLSWDDKRVVHLHGDWLMKVDELIVACPAVAEGLAAVERVRTLAEQWDEMARDHDEQGMTLGAALYRAHARHLRRALDGEP